MKRTLSVFSLCAYISAPLIAVEECMDNYKSNACFTCNTNTSVTSRTFEFIRPVYEHVVMRNHEWATSSLFSKEGTLKGAAQAIGMYQHSRGGADGNKKFAKYFLINQKSTLLVSGDSNTADATLRDIRAEWIGLPSNFRGFMTLCPEQSQAGVLLEYNQDIGSLLNLPLLSNSHVSIIVPFVQAKHSLHLSQSAVQNPGTTPGMPSDIIEAFNQPNWHNAKINRETERSQIPEIRFQFWRTYMDEDDTQLAYYSSFIIPTNTKPNPTYLFNATTGNGGHAAINAGLVLQVPITEPDELCGRLMWFLDLDASYRFHNHQWRTYDLKERPFSRYLLFATNGNPAEINIPGVNVLTVHSKVRAYGLIDFVTGCRWRTSWGNVELSYNVWAHSREHVHPDCQRIFNQGIQGTFTPGDEPVSASLSTINTQADNDTDFITIATSDLNIHSAATAGALTNALNAAWGLERTIGSVSLHAGLGGFVEWSTHNSPLDSWGMWGKFTASF
jgi:hypothetical protein